MNLGQYAFRRLVQAIPLILLLIVLNFLIVRLAPGDTAAYIISGAFDAPPELLKETRAKLGLDQPVQVQLWIYLRNLAIGDWGHSYIYGKPVVTIILPRLLNTLLLTLLALTLQVAIGVTLGVFSSTKMGSRQDRVLNTFSIAIWSLPTFWVGILMILAFAVFLKFFPVSGMVSLGITGLWQTALDTVWHMVLPVVSLTIGGFGLYFRLARASMLEVLKQDYITTAWSKGCAPHIVYFKHAFRNAILPLVTVIASNAGYLLTGAALIETIFAWPGIGYLLYTSIGARDYQMVQLIFLIVGVMTVLSNLVADLLYAFLDPRIRYQ